MDDALRDAFGRFRQTGWSYAEFKSALVTGLAGLGQLDEAYDRMILDCPPGLTETSEQVMRAADLIVVPVIPSPLSARALEEVTAAEFAQRIKQ